MKLNKLIIAIIAASSFLVSCQQDLLDTTPYGAVGTNTMWTTENLCDKGVLGIYAQLRNSYVGLAGSTSMDRYSVSTDHRDGTDALLDGSASSSTGVFADYWKQHYEGINRANDAIENLAGADVLADTKKARLIAESKFLRAYFYYKLNIMYKGVPIYEKNEELSEYRTRSRNTEAEVWTFILRDLEEVINEPNLPDKYESGSADFGRITKSAAYALRGKAYLWMENWAGAESDFKKVGSLGHRLYTDAGALSYKMLFKEANEQSDEMILSVQNISMDGYGADWGRSLGVRTSVVNGGWNTFMVNTDFANTYENADGTPFDWSAVIPTWDKSDPVRNMVYFLRDGLTEDEIAKLTQGGRDINLGEYLKEGNEARIKAIFDKRDPRMLQTMVTPYSDVVGTVLSADITYTLRWPYRGYDDGEPYDVRTDTNNRFHYVWRKFVPESVSEYIDRMYIPIDYPLIRYADVLLGLAEALNEQGKTDEAVTYVNMVRERAGIAMLNSSKATTVTGQDNMRERIRNERRWELAGESIDFYDEMRWKTWHTSTKFANGNGGHKQIWGEFQYHYNWDPDNRLYVWPIPLTERQINTNLVQNEGWTRE